MNKYQISDMPASDALLCMWDIWYDKLSENESARAIKPILEFSKFAWYFYHW